MMIAKSGSNQPWKTVATYDTRATDPVVDVPGEPGEAGQDRQRPDSVAWFPVASSTASRDHRPADREVGEQPGSGARRADGQLIRSERTEDQRSDAHRKKHAPAADPTAHQRLTEASRERRHSLSSFSLAMNPTATLVATRPA